MPNGDPHSLRYGFTVICNVPVALSVESVPVMVTVPVVPAMVPLLLPLVMLMMAELLDVNVVELVLSVPFSEAVKLIGVLAGLVVKLIGLAGLLVRVRLVDWPTVIFRVPETTVPLEDCAAAWTVAEDPAGVTAKAFTSPAVTLTRLEPLVTLQVAVPVRFL